MIFIVLSLILIGSYGCKQKKEDTESTEEAVEEMETAKPFFELSLAQWSIHRMIRNDGVDPYTFAETVKEWGFSVLDSVRQLYNKGL